jgi:hypothetical protein
MNTEEYAMRRLFCIAQMAATLEAGDRATLESDDDAQNFAVPAEYYAGRATALFEACDAMEASRLDAKYDEIDARDR